MCVWVCVCVQEQKLTSVMSSCHHKAVVSFSSFSAIRRAQNTQISAHRDIQLTLYHQLTVAFCENKQYNSWALCLCIHFKSIKVNTYPSSKILSNQSDEHTGRGEQRCSHRHKLHLQQTQLTNKARKSQCIHTCIHTLPGDERRLIITHTHTRHNEHPYTDKLQRGEVRLFTFNTHTDTVSSSASIFRACRKSTKSSPNLPIHFSFLANSAHNY